MSSLIGKISKLLPNNSKVSKATIISLIIALAGGIAGVSTGIANIAGIFQGVAGTNGINGINGINGENGTAGANGLSGSNGLNGTNGSNGLNGTSGSNGTNGTNGVNGTSFVINSYTFGDYENDSTWNTTALGVNPILPYVQGSTYFYFGSTLNLTVGHLFSLQAYVSAVDRGGPDVLYVDTLTNQQAYTMTQGSHVGITFSWMEYCTSVLDYFMLKSLSATNCQITVCSLQLIDMGVVTL